MTVQEMYYWLKGILLVGGGGGGLTNSWWWGEFKLEHAGTCSLMMGELINRCGGGSSRSVFRNHCYIWEVDD